MILNDGIIQRTATAGRSLPDEVIGKRSFIVWMVSLAVMIWTADRFGESTPGMLIMVIASVVVYVSIAVEIAFRERQRRCFEKQAAEAAAIARGERPES